MSPGGGKQHPTAARERKWQEPLRGKHSEVLTLSWEGPGRPRPLRRVTPTSRTSP